MANQNPLGTITSPVPSTPDPAASSASTPSEIKDLEEASAIPSVTLENDGQPSDDWALVTRLQRYNPLYHVAADLALERQSQERKEDEDAQPTILDRCTIEFLSTDRSHGLMQETQAAVQEPQGIRQAAQAGPQECHAERKERKERQAAIIKWTATTPPKPVFLEDGFAPLQTTDEHCTVDRRCASSSSVTAAKGYSSCHYSAIVYNAVDNIVRVIHVYLSQEGNVLSHGKKPSIQVKDYSGEYRPDKFLRNVLLNTDTENCILLNAKPAISIVKQLHAIRSEQYCVVTKQVTSSYAEIEHNIQALLEGGLSNRETHNLRAETRAVIATCLEAINKKNRYTNRDVHRELDSRETALQTLYDRQLNNLNALPSTVAADVSAPPVSASTALPTDRQKHSSGQKKKGKNKKKATALPLPPTVTVTVSPETTTLIRDLKNLKRHIDTLEETEKNLPHRSYKNLSMHHTKLSELQAKLFALGFEEVSNKDRTFVSSLSGCWQKQSNLLTTLEHAILHFNLEQIAILYPCLKEEHHIHKIVVTLLAQVIATVHLPPAQLTGLIPVLEYFHKHSELYRIQIFTLGQILLILKNNSIHARSALVAYTDSGFSLGFNTLVKHGCAINTVGITYHDCSITPLIYAIIHAMRLENEPENLSTLETLIEQDVSFEPTIRAYNQKKTKAQTKAKAKAKTPIAKYGDRNSSLWTAVQYDSLRAQPNLIRLLAEHSSLPALFETLSYLVIVNNDVLGLREHLASTTGLFLCKTSAEFDFFLASYPSSTSRNRLCNIFYLKSSPADPEKKKMVSDLLNTIEMMMQVITEKVSNLAHDPAELLKVYTTISESSKKQTNFHDAFYLMKALTMFTAISEITFNSKALLQSWSDLHHLLMLEGHANAKKTSSWREQKPCAIPDAFLRASLDSLREKIIGFCLHPENRETNMNDPIFLAAREGYIRSFSQDAFDRFTQPILVAQNNLDGDYDGGTEPPPAGNNLLFSSAAKGEPLSPQANETKEGGASYHASAQATVEHEPSSIPEANDANNKTTPVKSKVCVIL